MTLAVKAWYWRKYKHHQGSLVWNFKHKESTGYWIFVLIACPFYAKDKVSLKISL